MHEGLIHPPSAYAIAQPFVCDCCAQASMKAIYSQLMQQTSQHSRSADMDIAASPQVITLRQPHPDEHQMRRALPLRGHPLHYILHHSAHVFLFVDDANALTEASDVASEFSLGKRRGRYRPFSRLPGFCRES
eukprot:1506863-Pyramimonas_sp.AAC.1